MVESESFLKCDFDPHLQERKTDGKTSMMLEKGVANFMEGSLPYWHY